MRWADVKVTITNNLSERNCMCPQIIDLNPSGVGDSLVFGKMEIAVRQLKQAIRLFFEQEDIVSIHTLAYAAHTVLSDIGKVKGVPGVLRNFEFIKPAYRSKWKSAINEDANFFKHADRDPTETLEFSPFLTYCFLLDALDIYRVLQGSWLLEGNIFFMWMMVKYPDLFYDNQVKELLLSMTKTDKITADDWVLWKTVARNAFEKIKRPN
jgi:hypothetical protein